MTDYCKMAAKEIKTNVYDCLGCTNLIRTDCPQYENKTLEVTSLDFDVFFNRNHSSEQKVIEE